MKKYEAYKESKYDWLGKVPNDWHEHSIRSICILSDKRNKERTNLELLSVYREFGVIIKSSRDDNHNRESSNLSNYKYVDVNYLVMNKMKMWQGSLGVSRYEGIVSPAYIVCSLKNENISPKFLNYLLRSATFKTYYNRISYGIRIGQWDMRYDDFKSLILYLPSIAEQEQIVRYLDWKVALIDKFIRKKRREVELLKELRQAEINEAVTRGINPKAPMKPSGSPWIGEIPSHWDVSVIKRVFESRQSGSWGEEVQENDGDRICLRIADFEYDRLRFKQDINYTIRNYGNEVINRLSLINGDILIEKSGGGEKTPVGRAVMFNLDKESVLFANFMDRLRPFKSINSKYITYFLNCLYKKGVTWNYIKQTTGIQNLDIGSLISKEIIACPPFIEQQEIVDHLQTIEERINKAIEKTEQEIALIAEYKTSLISDVSTGKVDVRDITIPAYEQEELLIVEEATETEEP